MNNKFSDEPWDEQKWESHLNEIEQKSEQLRSFLSKMLGDEDSRWVTLLKHYQSEQDAVDAYIEDELMFEEAYLPDDDDDYWDLDEDEDLDDFLLGLADELDDDDLEEFDADDEEFDMLDDDDFLEEGEEWKLLSDEYAMSDYGSIENLGIYKDAHKLAVRVLALAGEKMGTGFQKVFDAFVSEVLQINAKITAGYALGFEPDVMGGNIAYTKKGLTAANTALKHLQNMKAQKVFPNDTYYEIHANLFELRNDIGIYLQDLREMFNGGGE
jgi:hypothetical protein